MLTFLQAIWRDVELMKAHKQPPAPKPVPSSDASAPTVVAGPTHEFVRRETLIDRAERIAGYEFSLLDQLQDRLSRRATMSRRAFDSALLMRLALNDGESLLGQRLACVNLALDSLHDPLLMEIPAKGTLLMLKLAPGDEPDWTALTTRAAALHANGFALGLHVERTSDASCALMDWMSFVQVELTCFDGLALREMVAQLRHKRGPGGKRLRLIAHNLQSDDEFLFSRKSGFDYFHGSFVTGPRSGKAVRGSINRMVVLPILNMVRADASFAAIADTLRSEPTLTYKLLRYLNSPAMGLQRQIDSLGDALALVGRAKFYRWMSLLLFDFSTPSYGQRVLSERALTRGRTLELLAGEGRIPPTPEPLFLTGLFSLMDEVLERPLEELLARAAVPESVRDALLKNKGPLADALRLVTLGEADSCFDPVHLSQFQRECGIDDGLYSVAANQALAWSSTVLGASEQDANPPA